MEKRQILDELLKWRYAHRGFHQKPVIPENSMEAFRRAVEAGFGVELDVHLSKDGKLAVLHDASLWRTCGIDLYIEEITLEDAQIYFLEKSEERIPELGAVLEMVDGRVPLIVELKVEEGNHRELVDAVMETLKDYRGFYCIESFNPSAVGYLRKKYPDVVRGQLAGCLNEEAEVEAKKIRPHIDIDCVEYADTGLEGTFMDESFGVVEEAEENTLSWWQDFLLKHLWVNATGRPDFVAYQFEDRDMESFRNYKGAKFLWTITDYSDLKECEEMGMVPIFEQFNPKDYE